MKQRITLPNSRTFLWIATGILLALVIAASVILAWSKPTTAPKASTARPSLPTAQTQPQKPQPQPVVGFNKSAYSTSDASSLWVVVNKRHPLNPVNYSPSDLIQGTSGYTYSSRVQADLLALIAAATQQGVSLGVVSAYRSYDTQISVYNGYVRSYSQTTADTISARPGYSEHQTGLALDMGNPRNPECNLDECFGITTAGIWLATHATDYGFIVRYQKDAAPTTGYSYEPWHIRYIGREAAAEYKKEGASSWEQFFGVSGGNYAS